MRVLYFVWTNESGKIYMIQALANGYELKFDLKTKRWGLPPESDHGELLRKAFLAPPMDMDQVSEQEAVKAGAVALTEELVARALYPPAPVDEASHGR